MRQQVTNGSGINYISHQNDGDDLSQQYESVFTDMAYQAFTTRFPDMAPMVSTFQVITSDIDDGSAVGAFLLDASGDIYHVPVVMVDNKIKPMDMIYSKKMDKFFPFTKEWLDVVQSSALEEEGTAVNKQDHKILQSPNDVSQTLQPPVSAYNGGLGLSPTGMGGFVNTASEGKHEDYKEVPVFTEFLKIASDQTKAKFLELLKGSESLFKFAAEKFNLNDLITNLKQPMEKKAAIETPVEDFQLMDMNTPVEKLMNTLGPKADKVKIMQNLAKRGFTAKDTRKNLNPVYDIESKVSVDQVETSGFYKILKQDGSCVEALILTNLLPNKGDDEYVGEVPSEAGRGSDRSRMPKEKLVILDDGSFFSTKHEIVGTKLIDVDKEFAKVIKGGNPKQKDAVTFIKPLKDSFVAVKPMYVDKVIVNKNKSTSYLELDPYYFEKDSNRVDKSLHGYDIGKNRNQTYTRNQIVISPSLKSNIKPFYSSDGTSMYLCKEFRPIVLNKESRSSDFILDVKSVIHHLKDKANSYGAREVKISNRGGDDYSVNGVPIGSKKETVEKVAREYHVPFETIFDKVASLENRGITHLYVIPFEKKASIFAGADGTSISPEMIQEQQQQQQQQQQQPPMPMDPSLMQQQQPPMPMDPSLMQAGQQLQNPEMYNLGAIQTLVEDPNVLESMTEYTPALEKAMDNTARLLLTLWTEGSEHRESLGDEKFKELEGSARNALKELGRLLLLVSRHPRELDN